MHTYRCTEIIPFILEPHKWDLSLLPEMIGECRRCCVGVGLLWAGSLLLQVVERSTCLFHRQRTLTHPLQMFWWMF
ncbi:hypothetical protein EYF80_015012 [Liparis tanakae]|uniref:Uncharacterized protein n=1 Tax=Liparis tanakae TaxID=230148 RepID=A0A4Z2IBH8_9TELE|nr:hypothetical protein EYF80_015012 [Liparis tanakae]